VRLASLQKQFREEVAFRLHSLQWAAVDIFGSALANRIGKTSQLNRAVESSPDSDLPLP
jgi:hypothetical protein